MSFPRYPKYKESGVEWLGEVPEGWEVKSLKHIAEKKPFAIVDGPFGTQLKVDDYRSSGVPLVRISNLSYDGRFSVEDLVFIDQSKADEVCRSAIRRGDIIVGKTGATIGKSALFNYDDHGIIASSCIKITPDIHKVASRFVLFAIVSGSFQKTLVNESGGSTRDTINITPFGRLLIAVPPLPEQAAIAEFLDRETAKIDELVAEQRRLMELLKEKRQAVISHAVTKGLNPHAPMKPSGIEWLGDVPEHWVVGPVKRFFTSCNTRRIPLSGEERGGRSGVYPYYGASGIIDHINEYIFDEDLILVSEDGANLLNRATPIAFVATGKYWVNNHAHILRPLDANLLFWAERIESIDVTPFVTGSAQPKFTSEALGALIISAPSSEDERAKIQKHIESETAKFDTLTAEAQRTIDLLQERRTALISAAVTGQIDVRNSLRN